MAVRQRIKGILYSPETIRVAFDYGSISDGKEGLKSRVLDSVSPAEGSRPGFAPQKEKESNLLARSDPFPKFDSTKLWSKLDRPQTFDVILPNIAHDYWTHYRLTGDYKLRPTL